MIRSTLRRVSWQRAIFFKAEADNLFSMLESSSYPRLHVPIEMPRQTEHNTSPATLYLSGCMHEIVLDGTSDGTI